MRQKYQERSITSVHMMRQQRKIASTKGPPAPIISRTVSVEPVTMSRTVSVELVTMWRNSGTSQPFRTLEALGEQSGALLVENLHDRARHRRESCVEEEQRNRDAEAEHCRDHRLADAVRHQARVART